MYLEISSQFTYKLQYNLGCPQKRQMPMTLYQKEILE